MCEHPQHPRADFPLSCEQRSSCMNHSKTTINTFLVFLMLVCVHQRAGFTQPHYWALKRGHKTSQDGTEACWALWWGLERPRKGVFPISPLPLLSALLSISHSFIETKTPLHQCKLSNLGRSLSKLVLFLLNAFRWQVTCSIHERNESFTLEEQAGLLGCPHLQPITSDSYLLPNHISDG